MSNQQKRRSATVALRGGFLALGLLASACGSTQSASPSNASTSTSQTTTTTSLSEVKAAITDLFYGEQQAWRESPSKGWEYALSHDYQGIVDVAKWNSCIANAGQPDVLSATPDLNTLAPANSEWVPQMGNSAWLITPSLPLRGATYTVSLAESNGISQETVIVHVTMIDGKAYYYNGPNC